MSDVVICADCKKPVSIWFDNGDDTKRCETCAVAKYKKDCPFWNVLLLKSAALDIKIIP